MLLNESIHFVHNNEVVGKVIKKSFSYLDVYSISWE